MIKRVIFDLDDTLLNSSDYFQECIEKVLKKHNISFDDILLKQIDDSFEEYEKEHTHYNEKQYQLFFNKKYNQNFTLEQIIDLNDSFIYNAPNRLELHVKELLDYLKNKYELVVLTNFYYRVQTDRLKKAGILEYFDKIYATDQIPLKPNPESYKIACGPYEVDECIMIGDNLENDYIKPLNLGMKAILYDKNNTAKYPHVKDLIEIKDIL